MLFIGSLTGVQLFCWFNCFSLGIVRNQIQFLEGMRDPVLTNREDDKGTQTHWFHWGHGRPWRSSHVPLQDFVMNADIGKARSFTGKNNLFSFVASSDVFLSFYHRNGFVL